jgi:hypothetical protein
MKNKNTKPPTGVALARATLVRLIEQPKRWDQGKPMTDSLLDERVVCGCFMHHAVKIGRIEAPRFADREVNYDALQGRLCEALGISSIDFGTIYFSARHEVARECQAIFGIKRLKLPSGKFLTL